MRTRALAAATAALLATAASAADQEWKVVEDSEWCDEDRGDAEWCEVREIRLPATGAPIEVDGGRNGGIAVHGWDRKEILLQAQIQVRDAGDDEEAAALASRITIATERTIGASGPERESGGPSWSVSYRLRVPRETGLVLDTDNGGITILEVRGDIEFSARNGGIQLAHVGGDVRGKTTNGGLHVVLGGASWEGEGLDVETTNGGIDVEVPDDYSARLFLSTVNGGVHSELPAAAAASRSRSIRATIGDGGALLRLATRNGGVSLRAI
jgi:opacity protein-like surface antigen